MTGMIRALVNRSSLNRPRFGVGVLVCGVLACATSAPTNPPAWWSSQQVLTGGSADDYAAANIGQLKTIASKAIAEMNTAFPPAMAGAGVELNALLSQWQAEGEGRDDYLAVNAGQVKTVAKLFYDRLVEIGLRSAGEGYPWPSAGSAVDDYALVNVGQIKSLFAFDVPILVVDLDGDGISNEDEAFWNAKYPGMFRLGETRDAVEDPDGDGVLNFEELQLGLDPGDPDSSTSATVELRFQRLWLDQYEQEVDTDPDTGEPIYETVYDWSAELGNFWSTQGFTIESSPDLAAAHSLSTGERPTSHWEMPVVGFSTEYDDEGYEYAVTFDSDSDGMPDEWEYLYRGVEGGPGLDLRLDDAAADPDSDGVNNAWEYALESHPLVPDGHLDYDEDGFSNAQEIAGISNPNDSGITPSVQMTLVSGGSQSAPAGSTLPSPIVISLESGGLPLEGADVVWSDGGIGGSWVTSGGAPIGFSTTNSSGEAFVWYVTPSTAGAYNLLASYSHSVDLPPQATSIPVNVAPGSGGGGGDPDDPVPPEPEDPPVIFTSWRYKRAVFEGSKALVPNEGYEVVNEWSEWVVEENPGAPANDDGFNGDADEQDNNEDPGDPRDIYVEQQAGAEVSADPDDPNAYEVVQLEYSDELTVFGVPYVSEWGRYTGYDLKPWVSERQDSGSAEFSPGVMAMILDSLQYGEASDTGWRGDGHLGVLSKRVRAGWTRTDETRTLQWTDESGNGHSTAGQYIRNDAYVQQMEIRLQSNKPVPHDVKKTFLVVKTTTTSEANGDAAETIEVATAEVTIPEGESLSQEIELTGTVSGVTTRDLGEAGTAIALEPSPADLSENSGGAIEHLPFELRDINDHADAGDDVTITPWDTTQPIANRNIAWIDAHTSDQNAAPRMPQLEFRIPGLPEGIAIEAKLEVKYERGNEARHPSRTDKDDNTDTVKIPENGDFKADIAGDTWPIWNEYPLQTEGFFGGDATLTYRLKSGTSEVLAPHTIKFRIGGRNPDDARCRTYIESLQDAGPNGSLWFAYAIAKSESRDYNGQGSRYNQFLELPTHVQDVGRPLWGDDGGTLPGGYGMFQVTGNTMSSTANIPRRQIWNWQENAIAGRDIIHKKKFTNDIVNGLPVGAVDWMARQKNANNANGVTLPAHIVSSVTFAEGTNRTMEDACTMKLYNGGSRGRPGFVDNGNVSGFILDPHTSGQYCYWKNSAGAWALSRYNNPADKDIQPFNYVLRVCEEVEP